MKHRVATDEVKDLVAAYSLGALETGEAHELENHLAEGCHVCLAELDGFSGTTAALALSTCEQQPPDGARAKLLSMLNGDHKPDDAGLPMASLPRFLSIHGDEGKWLDVGEGVRIKRLHMDNASGLATSLVRMPAGASLPRHRHRGVEQFFILEGDCYVHGEKLGPGDYHRAETGSVHESTYTINGTMFLLVAPEGYEVLEAR
ncbi:MAG: cupin domain-containing protein [Acidobacteriota bacterium]